ncbi:MAG: MBL fold metallo-hydrolase, partial [Desulfobacula sp.]|nr:MBL fold metallo-hydrolase [Desulfobacula sp.]
MEIKWLGTAGFSIKTKDQVFLIDPYLTRNHKAQPKQILKSSDIKKASQIFISHGHFDHLHDIAQIAKTTKAKVYCSNIASKTLKNSGVDKNQVVKIVSDRWKKEFDGFKAQAFFSEHIKFDRKLLLLTLLRINIRIPKYLHLFKNFPSGQVLSWRFYIEDRMIHFFGSAGSCEKELKSLTGQTMDLLLVPLQGHSDICNIAANYVKILQTEIVIPHHQDDFYPPISKKIDIRPFIKNVKK